MRSAGNAIQEIFPLTALLRACILRPLRKVSVERNGMKLMHHTGSDFGAPSIGGRVVDRPGDLAILVQHRVANGEGRVRPDNGSERL